MRRRRDLESETSYSGTYVIKVEERIPPPPRLSILIGEVAGSLNSALDHYMFSLVEKFDPARATHEEGQRDLLPRLREAHDSRAPWVPRFR